MGSKMMGSSETGLPSIFARMRLTTASAMREIGYSSVVSGGLISSENAMSSKPTTEISLGIFRL